MKDDARLGRLFRHFGLVLVHFRAELNPAYQWNLGGFSSGGDYLCLSIPLQALRVNGLRLEVQPYR